jgi:hypothetical protein
MARYEDRSRPEVDPEAGPGDVNEPPLAKPAPSEPVESQAVADEVELDQAHTKDTVMSESPEERESAPAQEPSRAAQATEPEALESDDRPGAKTAAKIARSEQS